MSNSISLKDLLNMAIGYPELGSVNFNALYSLFHGLLEHLQLGDVQKNLTVEERAFIQPGSVQVVQVLDAASPSALFHQLQDRVSKMEGKLVQLDSLPSSATLLQESQLQNKPVEEMWQLMQLKNRMDANDAGVNKVMSAFQELLSTFNAIVQANNLLQEKLAAFSDMVSKVDIPEMDKKLRDLESLMQNIPLLSAKLDDLQKKLDTYPEAKDLVTWPTLHDELTDKTTQSQLSNDVKQENVKKVLNDLGTLSSRHEGLQGRVLSLEEELKKLAFELASKGIPEDLLLQLSRLKQDMEKLFADRSKDNEDLNALKNALHELNLALQKLESKTDKMSADLSETATFQSQIDELERKKLDKEALLAELMLKADKQALDTKAGHDQLEAAINGVNAILDDLVKKLALQESEWQNMLEKLLAGLEDKLSQSDLDAIHKALEELWKFIRKHLKDSQAFDPDGAAGSRKKLFERVKCISCDRPVTLATGPHLVTVRTVPLLPRNQSAEFGKGKNNSDPQKLTDPEFQYTETPRPHTACSLHRVTPCTQNLTTVYPYGDPGQIQYKNSEFDLMGIDGVMYKGRLDASGPSNTPEREAIVKTPQPPNRMTIERARSAAPHFRSLSASNTRTPLHSTRTSRTSIQVPSATELSPPTYHVLSTTEAANLFQRPLLSDEPRGDS